MAAIDIDSVTELQATIQRIAARYLCNVAIAAGKTPPPGAAAFLAGDSALLVAADTFAIMELCRRAGFEHHLLADPDDAPVEAVDAGEHPEDWSHRLLLQTRDLDGRWLTYASAPAGSAEAEAAMLKNLAIQRLIDTGKTTPEAQAREAAGVLGIDFDNYLTLSREGRSEVIASLSQRQIIVPAGQVH